MGGVFPLSPYHLHTDTAISTADDALAQLKSILYYYIVLRAIVSYLNVVFGALRIRTSGGRAQEPAAVVCDGRAGVPPETARPAYTMGSSPPSHKPRDCNTKFSSAQDRIVVSAASVLRAVK